MRWITRGPVLAFMVVVAIAPIPPASAAGSAESNLSPNFAEFTCALPALPHGVAHASPSSFRLSGPAVSALQGSAARHGFSIDGKDLVVEPPRRSDIPQLDAHQALCGAMASTGGLSPVAASYGVAVGYGRVSIAKKFFPAITTLPYPGVDIAQNPFVTSFHNRLAWVVIVHTSPPAIDCPAESHPVRLLPRPGDHGYEAFVIDADTGSDALLYWEGGPGGCTSGARVPPHVGVPGESVSVPWTLLARDPNGYSGTIAATAFACDKVPNPVLVDSAGPNVAVVVTRPYGWCGQPESIPIDLHAADVTADLPETIGHDPLGLLTGYAPPTPPGAEPPTTTTTQPPALVPVDISTSGQTLDVNVGEVVTMNPLPGAEGNSFTNPATSTNPIVLGPLTSSPQPLVAEFRAWKPGTADITVPQSACIHPGSDQSPCRGAFVVHVVVR